MAYIVATVRELDDQQPPSAWVANAIIYDPHCENEEQLEEWRQLQEAEFGADSFGSIPQDQAHIHLILKIMWELEFLKPPEDPLWFTPEGLRWHREHVIG